MKTPLTLLVLAATLSACGTESSSTSTPEGQSAVTGQGAASNEGASSNEGAATDAAASGQASTTDAVADPVPVTTSKTAMSEAADLPAGSLYSNTVKSLSGETVNLADYAGKVTLIVNVASRCGYTRQYEGLQKLHEELGGDKFALLAFPSNDFGGQEPGTPDEIQEFCSSQFGVSFAMFEKVPVKAAGGSPVYDRLAELTGERPGWNFCKYVVSPDGTSAKFFKSGVTPGSDELREAIRSMME